MTEVRNDVRLDESTLKVRDAELEAKASDALLPLMKLRWEQTLGGGGYSFAEYARVIGRNESAIRRAANGFALLQDPHTRYADLRAVDAYAIGDASEPERDAIVATAEATDAPISEVRRGRRPDLKAAKQAAREAVDKGEDPREAAKTAAENASTDLAAKRAALREQEDERKKQAAYFAYTEAEGHLLKARREVAKAIAVVRGNVGMTDEMREYLAEDSDQLRASVGLFDVALVGSTEVDWDAELEKMTTKEERS